MLCLGNNTVSVLLAGTVPICGVVVMCPEALGLLGVRLCVCFILSARAVGEAAFIQLA